ncbi:MAG: ATP-binding protein [Halobacteriaceae archaeon]
MSERELDVIELLLTAHVYRQVDELGADDLPPSIRAACGTGDGQPVVITEEIARDPWEAISGLMFTDNEPFSGRLKLVDEDMAVEWYEKRTDEDRLLENPVLAHRFGNDEMYERARGNNRSARADRAWIDARLEEAFDPEDEDDAAMLDLVDVRAPEEVELTLDDIVLTEEQEAEVHKVAKAIEHREYLAQIGLSEIGKLLFVGPPGTAKTSTARALAHDLELPFVEVKLSMITSQYLGETAKNVEKVFEVAKRLSPCIFFIDEFDFVAKTRSSDEHAAIKRAVNTLLKNIDEISLVRDDVLLVGATNHPGQLDAAAWRRFDEILEFPEPDETMRSEILRVVTRDVEIENFDPQEIAAKTDGLTGSDLRLVLREAVLDALLDDRQQLSQEDLVEAVEDFERRDSLKALDPTSEALVADGDGIHDH